MRKFAGAAPVVLILEDEALIAVNLQDELQDRGYAIAGPFTTCADALHWLQSSTPDVAVLDTVLKDGLCREIAVMLAARSVPFVIYSGHQEDKDLLPELHAVTWIEKPAAPSVLAQQCRELLPSLG